MYRRYEPDRRQRGNLADTSAPQNNMQGSIKRQGNQTGAASAGKLPSGMHSRQGGGQSRPSVQKQKTPHSPPKPETKAYQKTNKTHPITKFIPQSLYNPETGKVLGFLSAEDLLIVALILLLIDSGDEEADNTMLIYALIYILISEHVELPFL